MALCMLRGALSFLLRKTAPAYTQYANGYKFVHVSVRVYVCVYVYVYFHVL